jgi:hypothetical protein
MRLICRMEVTTMMAMGKDATTPAREEWKTTSRGVLKYSQATRPAQTQPANPAWSAAVCLKTSKIKIRAMGSNARMTASGSVMEHSGNLRDVVIIAISDEGG